MLDTQNASEDFDDDGEFASGNDIIDGLMEHMESEALAEQFYTFFVHASISQELLESDEDVEEGNGYCVVANQCSFPINGKDMSGIYVAIWPCEEAPDGEWLPAGLSRARHARFLEVDPQSELVCEMHHLPILH
jgi:hypothetical protein